jgi:hypothetical protein
MAPRRLLGCLSVAALFVSVAMGCSKGNQATAELDKRCEQLAKACGDNDKHIEKIVEECKQAAKQQAEKKCSDKAIATYDCFEKELCGGGDKVWTLDDLRVLANRHKKCVAEQKASSDCLAEAKK